MCAYNLDKNRFMQGFSESLSSLDTASWSSLRSELVSAGDLLVRLNAASPSALAKEFVEYGRATGVFCVALKNLPGEVVCSDALFALAKEAFNDLYGLAEEEVRVVLAAQVRAFRDRNGSSDARVLSRLVKLHYLVK